MAKRIDNRAQDGLNICLHIFISLSPKKMRVKERKMYDFRQNENLIV